MSKSSYEVKTVDVGGVPLAYVEKGQGEALIMIHGGGPGATGISNYRRNVDALAEHQRVLVIDLPGYGGSPSRPISNEEGLYDFFADIVLGFMDALGIAKASFVGNSLGGGTSLCVALKAPERVNRMILMGPGGGYSLSPTPTEGLKRMFLFYEGEGPTREKLERVIDLLVFDPSTITKELLDERFAACTRPDTMANPPLRGRGANPKDDLWRRPLYSLNHPTLIIWGREDRVLSFDNAFVLLKAIPNAELHIFPKCGHWAQWEKADVFNQMVNEFLARP
jgi:4,5:9,10-diseco-3-hydroxy-5,9,17-trioxoandrosta-1(10),2-diene-4-oate hydrolase